MRRLALPLLLLVLAAPADAATTKVRRTACLTSVAQDGRAARFEGDMRTVAGATRLQMRFTLQARSAEEPGWTRVKAPGFGVWNSSVLNIGRFVYVKTVENLLAPASYRAVVQFRWLGAGGKSIARTRRVSRLCRQPDLRPDLEAVNPAPDGDGYAVTVMNTGQSEAGAFTVTVEAGGRTFELGRVARLAAGAGVVVRGPSPRCAAGEAVTIRVDAADAVDEAEESANVVVGRCAPSN